MDMKWESLDISDHMVQVVVLNGGDATCTSGPALLSIEVDTYYNGGQDLGGSPLSTTEIEDTGWHSMRVVVHILVEIDGVVYMDQDVTDFPAYIGFTAGTGGDQQASHREHL